MNLVTITDKLETALRQSLGASPATFVQQMIGIDFLLRDTQSETEYTISVKNQKRAGQTGNYAFELYLKTADGHQTGGCFWKDESDYTIMSDTHRCWVFNTKFLKDYVTLHDGRMTQTTAATNRLNVKDGRKYICAVLKLFPIGEINSLALFSFKDSIDPKLFIQELYENH